jgi:enamine deaminase RidA (YjgF/YER057c/UK114 family)
MMTDIRRFEANDRMSQAVVHGDTVYLAGQIARDNAGKSVTEQTQEVLRRVDALLEQAGTDKSRILSATIYLADIATFGEMNAAWDAWVAPGKPPARSTLEAKLAAPQFMVEITVTATL